MALADLLYGQRLSTQQNHSPNRDMFHGPALNDMSYWEQNWRRNLKLITIDEVPPSQQMQVSRWLQVRYQHLLGASSDLEAECLIQEFDDCQDACC